MSFANVDEALGPLASASARDPREHGGFAAMLAGIGSSLCALEDPGRTCCSQDSQNDAPGYANECTFGAEEKCFTALPFRVCD